MDLTVGKTAEHTLVYKSKKPAGRKSGSETMTRKIVAATMRRRLEGRTRRRGSVKEKEFYEKKLRNIERRKNKVAARERAYHLSRVNPLVRLLWPKGSPQVVNWQRTTSAEALKWIRLNSETVRTKMPPGESLLEKTPTIVEEHPSLLVRGEGKKRRFMRQYLDNAATTGRLMQGAIEKQATLLLETVSPLPTSGPSRSVIQSDDIAPRINKEDFLKKEIEATSRRVGALAARINPSSSPVKTARQLLIERNARNKKKT